LMCIYSMFPHLSCSLFLPPFLVRLLSNHRPACPNYPIQTADAVGPLLTKLVATIMCRLAWYPPLFPTWIFGTVASQSRSSYEPRVHCWENPVLLA
jgi:hypothetical protein